VREPRGGRDLDAGGDPVAGDETEAHPTDEAPVERARAAAPPADKAAADEDETYYCDLCGNVMLNLHCKLICERCGYKRDCSDP